MRNRTRHGVIPRAAAEEPDGMATREPLEREPAPVNRTVNVERFQRIGRAGGLEAAATREKRRKRIAIGMDRQAQEADEQTARERAQRLLQIRSRRHGGAS